ncbi:Crp/Fnr family transcriptional regulator [Flavivirga algicola]|uniref:Crp/Fnr family transcriptional regulator n=1 Tax=Flavivirga algicola TaxID=2729136 RepID=A0ABX1RWS5_9FLAO|nr:Crp/Fnr family transcriptional regulator [Flavivirga algicola]NMH88035.1 Crp/Fnr family transcriptional regulator [Flavivirga algicola]
MHKIREGFEQIVKLSDLDWQVFSSKLKKSVYNKKATILKVGETENHISFIEKGALLFFIPKLENDITFSFCFENEFVSAYDSFITRNPSTYEVKALTETILWRLTYQDLQDVYNKTEAGNVIGRIIAENLYLKKLRREQSFLNETPEERYLNLFVERPELIKKIPLKYLASYIGITPQALSRIRKRIF